MFHRLHRKWNEDQVHCILGVWNWANQRNCGFFTLICKNIALGFRVWNFDLQIFIVIVFCDKDMKNGGSSITFPCVVVSIADSLYGFASFSNYVYDFFKIKPLYFCILFQRFFAYYLTPTSRWLCTERAKYTNAQNKQNTWRSNTQNTWMNKVSFRFGK